LLAARRLVVWGAGLFAAAALLFALDLTLTSGEVHGGVRVGTVSLGGKTAMEAREALEDELAGSVEAVRVGGPGNALFTAKELGVVFDAVETADRTYAVGREGNLLDRLGARVDAALGGAHVAPEVEYDPAVAREEVRELREEPIDAAVAVMGDRAEVREAKAGYVVDVEATVAGVIKAAEEGRDEAKISGEEAEPDISTGEAEAAAKLAERAMSGPVVFFAGGKEWVFSPVEIGDALNVATEGGSIQVSLDEARMRAGLEGAYAELVEEPVEAGYMVEDGEVSVMESRTGKRIEEDHLFEALETGLFEGRRRFEVPVVTDEPDLTTDEAQRDRPTALLGRYRTDYMTYDDSPGRVDNLEIASDAVNGTVLAPDEIFSFNALAEPLEYYETKVIVNGAVDYSEGGGLCQVASTLYMAANYAGLKTVERHPHYSELPYIRPGFDATVWFGSLDMKLKNNTGAHVLLREWVDDEGYVNAEVWGRPTGKKVEMASQLVSTYADDEGNPVTEWVTYRRVTKDGEVISDGTIHTDTYGYLKP
jgi:vancomycin resistance protein YoaR